MHQQEPVHQLIRRCTNGSIAARTAPKSARIASILLTHRGETHHPILVLLRCKTVSATQRKFWTGTGECSNPRFERADAAAAHWHQIGMCAGHLDQFVVAGALVADDPADVDDVAAVNPDKTTVVEPRFDVADGQRAKQLVVAVKDISVMRVGMNRDHVVDGDEMRAAVALNRKMTGKAPRRRTRPAERRVGSASEFGVFAFAAGR